MNGHGHAASMDIYHQHHHHDDTGLAARVSRFFKIEERGSSIGREIRAGVVTFLTIDRKSVV